MSGNGKARRPRRIRRSVPAALLLGVSLLFAAIFLSFSAQSAVSTPDARARLRQESDVVYLPTPSRPVAKGDKLSDVEFIQTAWPQKHLSSEYLRDREQHRHSVALTSLPPHLPVPLSALSVSNQDSNVVIEEIPAGMRAITVKVDVESAVEGWARSGSFVDVILIRKASTDTTGMLAKVIAENVRILSAGRSTVPLSGETSAPQAPGTVTLLVSQQEALTIKTASSIGKLTFSLRGLGDQTRTVARTLRQSELIAQSKDYIPKTPVYHGRAKGPDGRTYVLGEDLRWVRSFDVSTPIQQASEKGEKE